MTTISAKIIADSISPDCIRLTTMHLRYPRFIHAEFMTHRVFSRNARSSRAVPVERMIAEVENDPVVPLHWGAAQKGMQADHECKAHVFLPMGSMTSGGVQRRQAWIWARNYAVETARAFHAAGYHKQIVNRLLEPFMHIDTLVTATDWANFLALRDHPAAEPHIAMLAREVRAALDGSEPVLLQPGEWHLPYIRDEERHAALAGFDPNPIQMLQHVSVARCARISYKPFDGEASVEAELARAATLIGARPMHASPAEHQATPDQRGRLVAGGGWYYAEEHGNLRGWRQYRKMLPGEAVREAA